jgi:hypothetical protein
MVFENRVPRKAFGPKKNYMTGGWRKVHKKELRDLCFSPIIIIIIKWRRMRGARHVALMDVLGVARIVNGGEVRLLVGKSDGKKLLGRPRSRWLNNMRIDLGDVGCGDMDWICVAEDRKSVEVQCLRL